MSRTTRGVLPDAQVRALSDEHILEFLGRARQGLASAEEGEAAAYADAVATLELETVRRGLAAPSPHERMPETLVLRRLETTSPEAQGEWPELLRELNLPGLWKAYLYTRETLPLERREAALVHVALAVDGVVFGEAAAWARHLRYVELPRDPATRLARLYDRLEQTFGLIFDAMSEGDARL